jgi:hypothetical protein
MDIATAELVKRAVAAAPPATAEQRARIAALLLPVAPVANIGYPPAVPHWTASAVADGRRTVPDMRDITENPRIQLDPRPDGGLSVRVDIPLDWIGQPLPELYMKVHRLYSDLGANPTPEQVQDMAQAIHDYKREQGD